MTKAKIAYILLVLSTILLIALFRQSISSLFLAKNFNQTEFFKYHSKSQQQTGLIVKNNNNVIQYLYDDFSSYTDSLKVLEDFESSSQLTSNSTISLNNDNVITGNSSLKVMTSQDAAVTTLSIPINADLSNWSERGVISFWLNLSNRTDVSQAELTLFDKKGNQIVLAPLENKIADFPNNFNKDDIYPDIKLPDEISSGEWTDFWFEKGWNYSFFQIQHAVNNSNEFDFKYVDRIEVSLHKSINESPEIFIDNLQIQTGIQKENNSLKANWYPPLGLPQYGIYSRDSSQKNGLYLLNVRNSQYPSNGDHGRILSQYSTPMNFALRTRFKVHNLDAENKKNTFIRFFYDFDPEYDPGHDWFGVNISLEYNKFSLLTVIPIERFSRQEQEPENAQSDTDWQKTITELENNQIYEFQLFAVGQFAKAFLYKVEDEKFIPLSSLKYTFDRDRLTERKYPLGMEVTGNTQAQILNFEVTEIAQ